MDPPEPSAACVSGAAPISLPVISTRPVARRSTVARWRAAFLIAIYVLMTAHVLHWWITGRSIGRFVLSDSMRTLEQGEINPGFLLFASALIVTALLGRFMCGWICHLGALQDLAAWMLRRVGVRPHMFRARLLGYVPLGLALYMFVWPTFAREVVAPLVSAETAATLGIHPFPGFSLDMTTDHLWEGLPSLWLGIPFLLVCGFLTVLFLGARGLCRYVCPYGGLLLPAEQLAIGRVSVDASKCDHCGICTATCTAGVRVLDELKRHGAVLDRNCIRSLDCIGACPQRALSLRSSPPAVFARSGKGSAIRYDLTWPEEIGCIVVFLAAFFTLRGLYGFLPLLMAAPLAAIAAYLAWKSMRLLRDPNVVFARMQIKRSGRLTGAGRGFALGAIVVAALLAHCAAIRILILAAERHDDRVTIDYASALRQQGIPADQRESAAEAIRLYRLAGPVWSGGLGLARTPEASVRLAWLEIVAGRPANAVAELEALLRSGQGIDSTATNLADLLLQTGRGQEAVDALRRAVATNPGFHRSRAMLSSLMLERGDPAGAERLLRERLADRPTDSMTRAWLGRMLFSVGRGPEGLIELAEAARLSPRDPEVCANYAQGLFTAGRVDDAVAELDRGAGARPASATSLQALRANLLSAAGRPGMGPPGH